MPDDPNFRDFGALPVGLPPPVGTIRSFLSTGRVIGQYLGTAIVAALGLGLVVAFALFLPQPFSILACAAAFAAFGALVYQATHNDYRWVELDGNTLRAGRLYFGRTIERPIAEIQCLGTMFYQVRNLQVMITEKLLGRIKGVEIRFRDGRTPLRVLRSDPAMTSAKELIEGVLYRMQQAGELDVEIVTLAGQPLIRTIYWKGEPLVRPPTKDSKVKLISLIGLAFLFGTIGSFMGAQEQEKLDVTSVPPHEMTLQKLIEAGPGDNRHVVLTDFRPGGYVVESQNSVWTGVWVVLFPANLSAPPAAPGPPPGGRAEIKAVLSVKHAGNEADLHRLLRPGRITGVCSTAPQSGWGMTLGPELVKSNGDAPLESAWKIEEMSSPPSATWVATIWTTSGVLFVITILLSAHLIYRTVTRG